MIKRIKFDNIDTLAGLLTIFAGFLGILFMNSNVHNLYKSILSFTIFNDGINFKEFVAEVLMVIFFLHVGIELKKEMCEGVLKNRRSMILPFVTAFSGMVVPACIYIFINQGIVENEAGFAVPCATDIAFAIAIFNLCGKKAPISVKILLLAIAIFDDLGAIILIAVFYTKAFAPLYLIPAFILVFVLILMMIKRFSDLRVYLAIMVLLGIILHKAGIHTTIAGVITGLVIPFKDGKDGNFSPVKFLGEKIHATVLLIILPLFAFTACNIDLQDVSIKDIAEPAAFGVFLGLFLGKQIGIFVSAYISIKLKLSPMPHDAKFSDIYAISILGGIGFTMSLFIGELAFPATSNLVKLGLLLGSCAAAIYGIIVFTFIYYKSRKV